MNIEDFVFGSFCFIKSKSGNIIGEFLNNKNSKIFTESADLTKVIENSKEFTGEYITTWQENNVAIVMKLDIKKEDEKYLLTWRNGNDNKIFFGEGFLISNELIGCYTNKKNVLQQRV